MDTRFREAFIEHVRQHGAKVAVLERSTGVPRSIINKLLRRENKTTSVEHAIALAGFFGKTVDQFIQGSEPDIKSSVTSLLTFLSDDELGMLRDQIKGLTAAPHRGK